MIKDVERFKIIVAGSSGGPFENNLSGYLVAPKDDDRFIACDAGALLHGIDIAYKLHHFKDLNLTDAHISPPGVFLQKHVKSYLISHSHLDHIMALAINSQADAPKPLFALDATMDNIRDHIFNGAIWPNYGSEGKNPLNRYSYVRLKPFEKVYLESLEMYVEAFPLNHSKSCTSAAFLLEKEGAFLLYFGDTASDTHQSTKCMQAVWQRIAPLVKNKALHGMFLECSYDNHSKDEGLHAHLTPALMLKELHVLAGYVKGSLKGLPILVTHRKDPLINGLETHAIIAQQLNQHNDLGVDFIFPVQGDKILL